MTDMFMFIIGVIFGAIGTCVTCYFIAQYVKKLEMNSIKKKREFKNITGRARG